MVKLSSAAAAALYTSLASIPITWIAVGLRFYTRGFIVRTLGRDDWAMLVTAMFFTGFCVTLYQTFAVVTYGSFTNFNTINLATNYLLSSICIYLVCSLLLKISLMLFFLRILVLPWQRWTLYISTALFGVFSTGFFCFTLFECGDPRKYLLHTIENKCASSNLGVNLTYAHGVFNAVVDCIFTGVAIKVISELQMGAKAKRLAVMLLMLGGVASICSMIRLGWIHELNANWTELFQGGFDLGTLSCLEVGLGIVASSLATLKPLLVRFKALRPGMSDGRALLQATPG